MVLISKTLFMRDLKGNWVFPRLAYAATGHAIDRNLRKLFRFLIRRPWKRVSEFLATVRDHQTAVEILLAGFAVFVAFIRALAFLALASGALYLAVFRF
jgi:hypothetical protein